MIANADSSLRGGLERLFQLPVGVHLPQDVAPAHELAVDEHLRDRGPAAERLDAVPELLGGQHVPRRVLHAVEVEDLHRHVAEPALRRARRALHVQEHAVLRHVLGDDGLHLRVAARVTCAVPMEQEEYGPSTLYPFDSFASECIPSENKRLAV